VAKHHDLELLELLGTTAQQDQLDKPPHGEVKQRGEQARPLTARSRAPRPYEGRGRPTMSSPQTRSSLRTPHHAPIRAPQANAHAERFVRTVRSECLDWLLILGRRHLGRVLHCYIEHYNRQRPHRGLALPTPERASTRGQPDTGETKRRDRLEGLIHEYHRAAA
jgi:putative transposase